ncbi:MAG: tetratricopeptide repeat protein [Treponema sp.]|jgi:tetratricopeptide (TPR) repeat protein|nr:tetratricopeptide repeat protein [Treponema sp.]
MKKESRMFPGLGLALLVLAGIGCSTTPKRTLPEGEILYEKGELDNAIAAFTEEIQASPNSAGAYSNRARAYYDKGDYDNSIADYTEAIRIRPNDYSYYTDRGRSYLDKSDYDNAIADFTEVAVLWGNSPAIIVFGKGIIPPYNHRGYAYFMKGDYSSAIEDLTRAIRIWNGDSFSYNVRGRAYAGEGDYDKAIADYTEALRLDPKNEQAKNNLKFAKKRGQ